MHAGDEHPKSQHAVSQCSPSSRRDLSAPSGCVTNATAACLVLELTLYLLPRLNIPMEVVFASQIGSSSYDAGGGARCDVVYDQCKDQSTWVGRVGPRWVGPLLAPVVTRVSQPATVLLKRDRTEARSDHFRSMFRNIDRLTHGVIMHAYITPVSHRRDHHLRLSSFRSEWIFRESSRTTIATA
jgi:hypothetical protein